MDKLSAMRTFVRIVEAGSLTGAADLLDVSLPTVVRTLAALERELGVSLLRRTTRSIHLTNEGAQYLERCRSILAAVEEAEDTLALARSEMHGKITVSASVLFGRRYIAGILNRFLQRHDGVTAHLLLLDRLVNLVEEGVDVAVRIGQLQDSSMMAVPVGRVRRVLCASEQYLRQHGVPQAPNDIRKHRCVRHVGLAPRSEWRFRVGNRSVMVPIESLITCNDIDSALTACTQGVGLGVFLSYMVAPARKAGRLRYLLETFEPEPLPVQMVYAPSKLLSATVRAFVDDCVRELRKTRFD